MRQITALTQLIARLCDFRPRTMKLDAISFPVVCATSVEAAPAGG